MDDRLKQLMQNLGDAINESLSESESIAAAIGDIKRAGYDVFLVLEATIGFDKRQGDEEATEDQEQSGLPAQIIITAEDRTLLKKMHIVMPGNDGPKEPPDQTGSK